MAHPTSGGWLIPERLAVTASSTWATQVANIWVFGARLDVLDGGALNVSPQGTGSGAVEVYNGSINVYNGGTIQVFGANTLPSVTPMEPQSLFCRQSAAAGDVGYCLDSAHRFGSTTACDYSTYDPDDEVTVWSPFYFFSNPGASPAYCAERESWQW